jgi:chitin disaccharide deacetylase
MKKSIVLCADDYGQAPAISQGIINLIEKARLSATSCMVNSEDWAEHAQWLLPYQQQIDIGLHFNLTEGRALSDEYQSRYGAHFQSLGVVLRRALLRSLSQSAIEAELHAQIDCFQHAMGSMPRYIDGHQHVHQFPVVRSALFNVYEQRLRVHDVYIRLADEPLKWEDFMQAFKMIMIQMTGAKALARLLSQKKIPHNLSFAGIYSFANAKQYPQLFPRFLEKIHDKGLIMCHPGLADSTDEDAIAWSRYEEYQYFVSDKFIQDCHSQDVVIKRF